MQEKADPIKSCYRLLDADRYKTKADVELHEIAGEAVPPADEKLVAEPKKELTVGEGEFEHNWGIADRLWRCEVVDTFSVKYFLLVFEIKWKEKDIEMQEEDLAGKPDNIKEDMLVDTGLPSMRWCLA